MRWLACLALVGCDPYHRWSDDAFPATFTPEENLPDYVDARVETEEWLPLHDPVMTANYVLKSINHKPSAPIEELMHFGLTRSGIPPINPEDLTIAAVGDVMPMGSNWSNFADPVASLVDGDLRIGNLETPVAKSFSTSFPNGIYSFNAPPEILEGLPLDVLQLNNNHSLDVGDQGLEETLGAVEAAGYLATGVDGHIVVPVGEAQVPVAVLSFTWGINNLQESEKHELFVVPFGHRGRSIDLSPVEAQLAAAEDVGSQFNVVMLHWGYEYEYYPDPQFMQLAREIIALGADVVVGSGPHVAQPAEICLVNVPAAVPGVGQCSVRSADGDPRVAAVFYSLGNFGTEMSSLQHQVGIIGSVSFQPGIGVTGLGWTPVAQVDSEQGASLVPLSTLLDDPVYAEEDARLQQLMGGTWRR